MSDIIPVSDLSKRYCCSSFTRACSLLDVVCDWVLFLYFFFVLKQDDSTLMYLCILLFMHKKGQVVEGLLLLNSGSNVQLRLGNFVKWKIWFILCKCRDIDEAMRDALHRFIEERGINESLFPFLQAWLYVKDHRNLMRWFKTVGSLVNDSKQGSSHA